MIGHGQSDIQRHHAVSENFRNEARKICEHTATLHPSRRHKTMQVQYPATISKLSSGASETSLQSNNSNSTLSTVGGGGGIQRQATIARGSFLPSFLLSVL